MTIDQANGPLSVGQLAARAGVRADTIRYYERAGLLPEPHRTNGGQTKLTNLICLCKRHHTVVHDKGIIIATIPDGFAFCTREGTPIPASPPLPRTSGNITTSHDAAITPTTIIPPNSGERLDLNLAIWIAFSNANTKAEHRQREHEQQAQTPAAAR